MESEPVWRPTVAVMAFVAVLIVASTSPGKSSPFRTARTSFPSGERPMDWTTPVPFEPFEGTVVDIVVTTVWLLKRMTEIPPPLPALAT